MRRTWAAVVASLVILVPATSWAQPTPEARFAREVSVSVGLGHVFVHESDSINQKGTQIVNRWENVVALVIGTRVRVQLADGSRIAGTLASVSTDQLVVTGGDVGTVAWGRDEVQRVEERRGPRLASGAGWGALVGVLAGAIMLKLVPPADSLTRSIHASHEIPSLAGATAIGVGTGLGINAARRRWVVVYRTP